MQKIIMLDWDGVVVNWQYQTTCDVGKKLAALITAGIKVVPNSDTPIPRLRRFFREILEIEAPIVIAERGALVALEKKVVKTKPIDGVVEFRKELIRTFNSLNHAVHVGDSTVWVQSKKRFEPSRRLILVDGLRQQTLGCFFLETDADGIPHINEVWGGEAASLASTLPLPPGLRPWDYNPAYGVAIANVAGILKTDGYRVLRLEYPQAQYFMVGDSDSDVIDDAQVLHCAVSNCSPGLRSRANFVANKPFTEGLDQCLDWIAAY